MISFPALAFEDARIERRHQARATAGPTVDIVLAEGDTEPIRLRIRGVRLRNACRREVDRTIMRFNVGDLVEDADRRIELHDARFGSRNFSDWCRKFNNLLFR